MYYSPKTSFFEWSACKGRGAQKLLCGLVLFFFTGSAWSRPSSEQSGWVLEPNQATYVRSHQIEFFRDPLGDAHINNRHDWHWFTLETPAFTAPTIGYTTDAIWGRTTVTNPEPDDIHAFFELGISRLKHITWFVLEGDTIISQVEERLDTQGARFPRVDFLLPAGSTRTVYLRIQSRTSIRLPLLAASAPNYLVYSARRDLMDHVFMGLIIGIFLLTLLNAWAQHDRLFGLLAILAASFLAYYSIYNGYYLWLGGPWPYWVNRNLMLATGMGGHAAFLALTLEYTRRSLAAPDEFQTTARLNQLLVGATVLLCVVPFITGVYLLLILACGAHLLSFGIIWKLIRRQPRSSHYLLGITGFSSLLILLLMYSRFLVWIPLPVTIVYLQRILLLSMLLVFFIIVTLQKGLFRYQAQQLLRTEQLAVEAQLSALRYQLNPHFLFNTLTSIDALSRKEPERIPSLVRKLATYLRLRLEPQSTGWVTFFDEWDAIQSYLEIEEIRFSDTLTVSHHIEPDILNARIPEMLLQPLTENALKHAIKCEGAIALSFYAGREGNHLHIRVENTGVLQEADIQVGSGIGLRNIRDRLAILYGSRASFQLFEKESKVVADILMPYEELTDA